MSENLPVQDVEDEQECGVLYDHDAEPGDTVCRECGAELSDADWD